MRSMAATLFTLTAACLSALPAAALERRVYAGREGQALQCAVYFSYTSSVLEDAGLMSTTDAEFATYAAIYIMEGYMGGTPQQKMAAYRIMLTRMPSSDMALVEQASRHLEWCDRTFLR